MADEENKVVVAHSHRMADPDKPDDLMHGKRFTDPRTGQAASIMDILRSSGAIGDDESEQRNG